MVLWPQHLEKHLAENRYSTNIYRMHDGICCHSISAQRIDSVHNPRRLDWVKLTTSVSKLRDLVGGRGKTLEP